MVQPKSGPPDRYRKSFLPFLVPPDSNWKNGGYRIMTPLTEKGPPYDFAPAPV